MTEKTATQLSGELTHANYPIEIEQADPPVVARLRSAAWRRAVDGVDDALRRIWQRTADDFGTRGGTEETTVHFVVAGLGGHTIVSAAGGFPEDRRWQQSLLSFSRRLRPAAVIVAELDLREPRVFFIVHRPDRSIAMYASLIETKGQGSSLAALQLLDVCDALDGDDFPFLVPVMEQAIDADVWAPFWLADEE